MIEPLGGALLAQQAGLSPVMQLTCRDRNRLAPQSDLLAAAAFGVPHVLLLTGDHPRGGDRPEAKPVFDLDGVQLTRLARTLRAEGVLPPARHPQWMIGTAANPFSPPLPFRSRRLAKKVVAGAEFVQTQYVFDIDVFAQWMSTLRDMGVTERCSVLAGGVGPIRSLRMLEFLRTGVPAEVERRLRGVPEDRVGDEGIRLCAETIQQSGEIPGVSGVHVMAFGFERGVPEILERAGLVPRARSPGSRRDLGFRRRSACWSTSVPTSACVVTSPRASRRRYCQS
ncbi:methylenetetrahydrofolate reductase [Streptomyces sp. MMS24-I2-30]|uniref:methylenetetrahydrofolate reductase n=1 Tax=Streptomyces sp. MMS24-I2-30 TaxID=3351564 RepID=UPI003896BFBF